MPDPMSPSAASPIRRPEARAGAPAVERPGRVRRFWSVLPVCAAFAVFGVVVWLSYQDASVGPPTGEPPLIKAAPDPVKLPPEEPEETALAAEPGTVGRLWSDAEQADQPERLLPPPEEPLSPPVVAEPAPPEQALAEPAPAEQTLAEPAPAEQALEESPREPATEPAEDTPQIAAAGEDEDGSVAALPSEAPAAELAEPGSVQSPTDASLQEAEAALDRLLAEVTALSEDTELPGATTAASAEEQGSVELPTERQESPAPEPAPATASAPPVDRAALDTPAAPPASEEPRPAPRPGVRPAGAPAAAAEAPEGSTETAALTEAAPPISPPPVAATGDFRIQLAAVREEGAARRAWNLFMADLRPVLSDVEPIFERAETANGVFYRVQIGPFASQQSAESLCEELKQRNASCFVIRR